MPLFKHSKHRQRTEATLATSKMTLELLTTLKKISVISQGVLAYYFYGFYWR